MQASFLQELNRPEYLHLMRLSAAHCLLSR